MNNTQTAEQIYSKSYNSASSKKKKNSILNIKKACDALALKYNKLTPASIGSHCVKAWGTPHEQSIRNNKSYVEYIFARENERLKAVIANDKESPIIVKDQAAQAIINILQDEKKELKKSISNLKKGIRQIAPIDIDKFIVENLQGDNNLQDLIKRPLVLTNTHDTARCRTQIKEIVKSLNEQLLEKYCQVLIDYKNDVIFNKNTGTIYWKNKTSN